MWSKLTAAVSLYKEKKESLIRHAEYAWLAISRNSHIKETLLFYAWLAISRNSHIKETPLFERNVCACPCAQVLGRVRLLVTPRTVARQAPLSMGISRQECRSGFPFPSPGDLSDPGIEPAFSASIVGFFTAEPPGKSRVYGGC